MPRRLKCRGISSARERMRFFVRYLILSFFRNSSLPLSISDIFQTYRLLYIVVRRVSCYKLVTPRDTKKLEGFFDESFYENLILSKLKG